MLDDWRYYIDHRIVDTFQVYIQRLQDTVDILLELEYARCQF